MLGQLARQQLVQLSVEHAVCDKLQPGHTRWMCGGVCRVTAPTQGPGPGPRSLCACAQPGTPRAHVISSRTLRFLLIAELAMSACAQACRRVPQTCSHTHATEARPWAVRRGFLRTRSKGAKGSSAGGRGVLLSGVVHSGVPSVHGWHAQPSIPVAMRGCECQFSSVTQLVGGAGLLPTMMLSNRTGRMQVRQADALVGTVTRANTSAKRHSLRDPHSLCCSFRLNSCR